MFLDGDIDFDVQGAQQYALDPSIAYDEDAFLYIDMDDGTTTLGALGEFGKRALGGIGTGSALVVSGLANSFPVWTISL